MDEMEARTDAVVVTLVVHEDGTSAVWHEPVVIKGNLGPDEKPPAAGEKPGRDSQEGWKSEQDKLKEQALAGLVGAANSMQQAIQSAMREAQNQVVYRMVRRSSVCKSDEDLKAVSVAAQRAQRVLTDLHRRGASPERASCRHDHAPAPLMMLGMGQAHPVKKGRRKKGRKPRGKPQ